MPMVAVLRASQDRPSPTFVSHAVESHGMTHKISIVVRADVDCGSVGLFISGCLTVLTVPILSRHIRRARELDPAVPVLVDLTGCRHIDARAVESLRAVAEMQPAGRSSEPLVRLEVPERLPHCPLSEEENSASPRRSRFAGAGAPVEQGSDTLASA